MRRGEIMIKNYSLAEIIEKGAVLFGVNATTLKGDENKLMLHMPVIECNEQFYVVDDLEWSSEECFRQFNSREEAEKSIIKIGMVSENMQLIIKSNEVVVLMGSFYRENLLTIFDKSLPKELVYSTSLFKIQDGFWAGVIEKSYYEKFSKVVQKKAVKVFDDELKRNYDDEPNKKTKSALAILHSTVCGMENEGKELYVREIAFSIIYEKIQQFFTLIALTNTVVGVNRGDIISEVEKYLATVNRQWTGEG